MTWTKEQQAAIDSRSQTLLLSAAAGSGKTAVLVERIIQRLLDPRQPVDITELLVVTFTKAAAAEMRDRVASALMQALAESKDERIERQLALLPAAHISTLHSFCQQVIHKYFYTIDLDPAFTIGGQEELNLLQQQVLEDIFLTYYEDEEKAAILAPLAEMFGTERGDDALMETVRSLYTYARSLAWPEIWLKKSLAAYQLPAKVDFDTLPWVIPLKAEIKRQVREALRRYDGALRQLAPYPALAAGAEAFLSEKRNLEAMAQASSWHDLSQAALQLDFPRLKALRKLDAAEKEIWERCKKVRNDVKKMVSSQLIPVYFAASPQEWLAGIQKMQPTLTGLVTITQDFARAYAAAKREKGWLDFSDLEHFCLQILLDKEATPTNIKRSAAAEELRSEYAEVLIDEYQDTNGVQELITRLVSGPDNRFMVGDIKQSIYRFRLADPGLFLEKYQQYSRDEKAQERCIDLAKNFRSAPRILTAVNDVFSQIMTQAAAGMDYGRRERLYAGRTAPTATDWVGHGPIEVDLLDSGENEETGSSSFEMECNFLASRIQQLLLTGKKVARKDGTLEPLSYRHIVILLRSLSGKTEVLLKALQEAGIPAYAEQSGGYFAASEVQVMLSLLRCLDNPEQELPLAAVLRSPLVGLEETTLADLRLFAPDSLWQNLPDFTASLSAGEAKEKLTSFLAHMEQWRTYSRRTGVAELLERIYADTGYVDFVSGLPGGAVRRGNLKALYDRARQYEAAGFRGLFRYLRLLEKMKEDGLDLAPAKVVSENEDVVRIMSIHKSKGLEFPVVFLADMGKNFNRSDSREQILFHKELGIGIKEYDPKWRLSYPTLIWSGIASSLRWEGTAEEERVLYVGMTRARDQLIITGHTSKLETDWQRWSSGLEATQANTYFDWLLPVVLAALGEKIKDAAPLPGTTWQNEVWKLSLCVAEKEEKLAAEMMRKSPALQAVVQGQPTGVPAPAWLTSNLSFTYAYPEAVETPAKFSVSEIKRHYQEENAAALAEEAALAQQPLTAEKGELDAFAALPPWLEEKEDTVSGAKRGTALHKALQYIAPGEKATYASLEAQVQAAVARGLLSPEEGKLVYIKGLLAFARSALGQRMAKAREIYREYPFTVLLAGGSSLPTVEKGEQILVQGVIDCLFKEKDGWILVDYKSDRLESAAAFKNRYHIQLELYRRAVEQISKVPVVATYIYSLHLQQEILL